MESFSQTRPCPKCGNFSKEINVRYHPSEQNCHLGGEEHMHRHCGECGYEWAEAPLS